MVCGGKTKIQYGKNRKHFFQYFLENSIYFILKYIEIIIIDLLYIYEY